jgi:hypothetical protein
VYLEGALLSKISLEQRVKHFCKAKLPTLASIFVSKKRNSHSTQQISSEYQYNLIIIIIIFVLAGALWWVNGLEAGHSSFGLT